MMGSKERHFAPLIHVSLEELVQQDHFYRHLERTLDLSFVREFVQKYNNPRNSVLRHLPCKESEYKTRRRNKAKLPRLYMERLMSFKRLICPSTGPVDAV
jgi:predicted secreted protein